MNTVKSLFDYIFSLFLLIVLIIPLSLLIILCYFDTSKSGVFKHKRIGKNGKPFYLYKLRTMRGSYESSITHNHMHITKLGKFLRNTKIDELPQLINILKGEISFVGPRPDVEEYSGKLKDADRIILSVKPGITGPAQLKYRNEDQLLFSSENPEEINKNIWEDKIRINKEYVENQSFLKDLYYLIKTIF